jgi:hypothetical protein
MTRISGLLLGRNDAGKLGNGETNGWSAASVPVVQ